MGGGAGDRGAGYGRAVSWGPVDGRSLGRGGHGVLYGRGGGPGARFAVRRRAVRVGVVQRTGTVGGRLGGGGGSCGLRCGGCGLRRRGRRFDGHGRGYVGHSRRHVGPDGGTPSRDRTASNGRTAHREARVTSHASGHSVPRFPTTGHRTPRRNALRPTVLKLYMARHSTLSHATTGHRVLRTRPNRGHHVLGHTLLNTRITRHPAPSRCLLSHRVGGHPIPRRSIRAHPILRHPTPSCRLLSHRVSGRPVLRHSAPTSSLNPRGSGHRILRGFRSPSVPGNPVRGHPGTLPKPSANVHALPTTGPRRTPITCCPVCPPSSRRARSTQDSTRSAG